MEMTLNRWVGMEQVRKSVVASTKKKSVQSETVCSRPVPYWLNVAALPHLQLGFMTLYESEQLVKEMSMLQNFFLRP